MKAVKLIVLDVDGTLTDGVIHYETNNSSVGDGIEHKHFHVADGLGIVMAQSVGLRVAVVSGRQNLTVAWRMAELNVSDVLQGIEDKAAALRGLMAIYGLNSDEIAYVGDDINDLPAFDVAGVRIAVADANWIVRDRADFITPRAGGRGAVRDAIEEILRSQGKLQEAVDAYLNLKSQPESKATQ